MNDYFTIPIEVRLKLEEVFTLDKIEKVPTINTIKRYIINNIPEVRGKDVKKYAKIYVSRLEALKGVENEQ